MLRRQSPDIPNAELPGTVPYPALDTPFVLANAPEGVHFYGPKEASYMPYATLQTMRLCDDKLMVRFATDEFVIHGRGLHSLYAHLADRRVKHVHEQGERYAQAEEGVVFVARIERQGLVHG